MVKKLVVMSATALLVGMGTASADPIALPYDSPIYFQFNNLEQFSADNDIVVPYSEATGTSGNWGVFNISTIQEGAVATPNEDISGGTAFFADFGALPHPQVTGIFYDVTVTGPTTATGGYLDLFWNDAGTIDASCLNGVGCAPDAATVDLFTTGTFLVRLAFASGIDPSDPTVFISSSVDPSTLTGTGRADSFANVVTGATFEGNTGAWESILNGDWFITDFGTRDIRFSNFFNLLASWDGDGNILGLRSNDPGRVFTAAAPIPEPATLALLGVGLLGLAYRRRMMMKRG